MRINQVIVESREQLVESLRVDNDTGCSPEDLALVVEAHRADVWSAPVDGDEYLRRLAAGELTWQ